MRLPGSLAIALTLFAQGVVAVDEQQPAATAASLSMSATTYQSAVARADIAVAKSVITPNILKGEVGEAIRNHRVASYQHRNGPWLDLSPRLGPQGLDHVSVQLDKRGNPRRLMVDETKFGSSRLGRTVHGQVQMDVRYTADRLRGLSRRYRSIASQGQGSMSAAKAPAGLSLRRSIRVPLSDHQYATFWRPAGSQGPWRYDGPAGTLPRALHQADLLANLLDRAADGKISYPRRIFQVKPQGNALTVTILDATHVDRVNGNFARLPVLAKLTPVQPGARMADPAILDKALANEIRRKMPHINNTEAHKLARGVRQSAASMEDALSRQPWSQYAVRESARVGAVAMLIALPLEVGITLLAGEQPNWARSAGITGVAGTSAIAGNTLGNRVSYLMLTNSSSYSTAGRLNSITGVSSATRLSNLAGGIVGGATTGVLFAYGGYLLGYYDLKTASRLTVAGFGAVGAGTATSAAVMGMVSAYGVAGTGAAISSLSGVAATNASLALLGGGTVAGGGAGIAGGTLLLGTGVGVVAVGAAAGIMYVFIKYDEHQDNIRLTLMLDYLDQKTNFITAPTG